MQIDPIYTPFNTDEVSKIIEAPLDVCISAKEAGGLEVSLFPDGRTSLSVAYHSLVDAVAFGFSRLTGLVSASGNYQSVYAALNWVCSIEDQIGFPPINGESTEYLKVDLREFGDEYHKISRLCWRRYQLSYEVAFLLYWRFSVKRGSNILKQEESPPKHTSVSSVN